MRPTSIIRFEQLFLGSLALGGIVFILSYEDIVSQVNRDPAVAQIGYGSRLLIGAVILSTVLNLVLWFLTARRASNIAKWLLILLALFGLIGLPGVIAQASQTGNLHLFLSLASTAAQFAGIAFLFRRDARAWFANKGVVPVEPAVFD